VDFFCDAPEAQSVRLVGDFNGWDLAAIPMRRMPDGRWMASLELHHGHHQYLFVVNGTPRLDPKASGIARNDRNERVSLVTVG
jgi:1,4-alpha-glucan branching enzyme